MKTMKIALIVLAVVTSFVVLGQNPPAVGAITGTVRDTSGAVIPGVTVTAVGPSSIATAISNARGSYVISNIQVGTYTVRATLPGASGRKFPQLRYRQALQRLRSSRCK